MINQKKLKDLLHYAPDTGIFTWLVGFTNKVKAGDIAGCSAKDGYIRIVINGVSHRAHRLAFLYMEGKFPRDTVDHKNRVVDDNRWANLRHATNSQNQYNRRNNLAFPGVFWRSKSCRWYATTRVNRASKHLGVFKTNIAACYARWAYDNA